MIKKFICKKAENSCVNPFLEDCDNTVTSPNITALRPDIIGIFIFFMAWTIIGWVVFFDSDYKQFHGFLPVPAFKALYYSAQETRFWISVWTSIKRIIVGIFIASALGIPMGIIIGFYPRLRKLTYTPIQFLRMISPLAWMPVALIVFITFESAVRFLIVMATIWPIILNTSEGVMNINLQLIKMALNQGADNLQILRTIVLPASVPSILASIRLALGVAWIVLVPAEFLGVASGLGYLINDARDTMEYDRLMAMIIAIGILGFTLDKSLQKN